MTGVPRIDDATDVSEGWDRDGRPPSIAIVESIAAIEGSDPTDLEFVLYDFVDPDALDRLLLGATGGDLSVELRVGHYLVTVRADGSLQLRTDGSRGHASAAAGGTAVSELG